MLWRALLSFWSGLPVSSARLLRAAGESQEIATQARSNAKTIRFIEVSDLVCHAGVVVLRLIQPGGSLAGNESSDASSTTSSIN